MPCDKEAEANNALKETLQAIQRTRELCERADYGSQVLGSLSDAQCAMQ